MTTVEKKVDLSKFTLNDINVGSKLYEVLVAHVVRVGGQPVYYSDLLQAARDAFPHDQEVQRAVPIGIGMKLLFVEAFCAVNGYPNLACLAVNRSSGMPGRGYTGNWEQDKEDIAVSDWSKARPALDAFVVATTKAATPRQRVDLDAAAQLVYAHFNEHRNSLYKGKNLPEHQKTEMTNRVMSGLSADEAFQALMDILKNGGDEAVAA